MSFLKEAGGLAGGALLLTPLTPLGVPLLLHGVAGIVVGGAGLFVADAVLKQVAETTKPQSGDEPEDELVD
jgi:hypothetical protein|uniref:Uncharacterized protein n=1 Tax=Chlorobium chlorochromatii (strain CaD3) TaxID=340177 RepID=Q3AUC9_CHLCH